MTQSELLVAIAVGLPGVGGVLAWLLRGRASDLVALVSATVGLLAAAMVAAAVLAGEPVSGWSGLLHLDALGGWTLLIVCAAAGIALAASIAWLDHEPTTRATMRDRGLYWLLLLWFIAALTAVPVTDNLGLVWVAIEATTITAALLIGFTRTSEAIEAAWKSLILGSVGVGFALLGTILVYASSVAVQGESNDALSWGQLVSISADLDPGLIRLAFVFVLVGYGTKAGLVPFHTWLPDAHSQAPSPVSALLSGATLAVSLLALARFQVVVAGTVGSFFPGMLLVAIGLLSLALAVPFLVAQGDLKRLLAYSSIEHIGLCALALGFGGTLALTGLALHLLVHALVKGSVFVSAGGLVEAIGSRRIGRSSDGIRKAPIDGRAFVVGTLLLGGLPPSALFVSELAIVLGGAATEFAWAAGIAALLLALALAGMMFHVVRIGSAGRRTAANEPRAVSDRSRTAPAGRDRRVVRATIAFGVPLVVSMILGIWTPPALRDALTAVVAVLEGQR